MVMLKACSRLIDVSQVRD